MDDDRLGNLRTVSTPVSVATPSDGLTDMARRFCEEFVLNGGRGTAAALAAGYSEGGAEQMAIRNLVKPKVVAEIKRLSIVNAGAALPMAIATLLSIMEHSDDDKARVAAANSILDRGGMAAPKGSPTVAVQVNMNGGTAQAIIKEVHEARSQRLAQPGDE